MEIIRSGIYWLALLWLFWNCSSVQLMRLPGEGFCSFHDEPALYEKFSKHYARGNWPAALQALESQKMKNTPESLTFYSHILRKQRRWGEAQKALDNAAKRAQKDTLTMAFIDEARGRLFFDKSLNTDKKSQSENIKKATEAYNKSYKIYNTCDKKQDKTRIKIHIIQTLIAKKKYKESIKNIELINKEKYISKKSLYNLMILHAQAQLLHGEKIKARKILREAISMPIDNPQDLEMLLSYAHIKEKKRSQVLFDLFINKPIHTISNNISDLDASPIYNYHLIHDIIIYTFKNISHNKKDRAIIMNSLHEFGEKIKNEHDKNIYWPPGWKP